MISKADDRNFEVTGPLVQFPTVGNWKILEMKDPRSATGAGDISVRVVSSEQFSSGTEAIFDISTFGNWKNGSENLTKTQTISRSEPSAPPPAGTALRTMSAGSEARPRMQTDELHDLPCVSVFSIGL